MRTWLLPALCGTLLALGTPAASQDNADTTVITYEGESKGKNLDKAQEVAQKYCQEKFGRAATLRSLGQRDGKNFALFKCT